jgi:hypothetical protein
MRQGHATSSLRCRPGRDKLALWTREADDDADTGVT